MTWFYASGVSVTNGQTVVSVNAGDDIQLAQSAGGLIIGTQPAVEIKRTFLDASSNKKIELTKPWPYGTQTNQPAMAFPTDGDLAAATTVLKQLIDGFTLATQAEAQAGTENTKPMTALRVKQAMDVLLGTASKLTATTSTTDATQGRALRVGDFGTGLPNPPAVTAWPSAVGTYFTGAVELLPNAPAGATGSYVIVVSRENHFTLIQNATQLTRALYQGVFPSATPTSAALWVTQYTTGNAVGAVGFSGGANTGAIIERGANANGEYNKFADGTMITTSAVLSANVSPSGGPVYISASLGPIPSPAAFADLPITGFVGSTSENIWFGVLPNVAGSYVRAFSTTSGAAANYRLTLVGRWR